MIQQAAGPLTPDSLRAIVDSVFAAPIYRWETVPAEGPLARLWRALQLWLYQLQRDNPNAMRALFWILVAALALVLAHAAWVAWHTVRRASAEGERGGGRAPVVRDAAWFDAEANRLAAQGRFAEAMQADFIRLMLELDARQVVRFHPSKTPAEFAREAPAGETRDALTALVQTLYQFAFARVVCGPAEFSAWRAAATADRYAPSH